MKKGQKPSKHGLLAEKSLKIAVAKVIEENRRLGLPVAVIRNGRAVLIKPTKKNIARSRK